MHIFVADEHLCCRYASCLQFRPPQASTTCVWANGSGGARKWLPIFLGPARRFAPYRSALLGTVTLLTLRENANAITYRRFDKRPSRGFVVFRSADECER